MEKVILTKSTAHCDVNLRKSLYERELENLSAAQTDLFQEYNIAWTKEDSKQASVWLANAYIVQQISILKQGQSKYNVQLTIWHKKIKEVSINLKITLKKISMFLWNTWISLLTKCFKWHLTILFNCKKLHEHPYILHWKERIPLSASKTLGANRWSDIKMMIEPTIGIPYLCSQLYQGKKSIVISIMQSRASNERKSWVFLCTFLLLPHQKECAGHLHMARKIQ